MRENDSFARSLKGRFGVIKLWPGVSVAEDECIARIKDAAEFLGLECVPVDYNGRPIDKDKELGFEDFDFILSLHFERPKIYPVYSYYAMWNPLQFYFDWGYEKVSLNAASHDAYLSSDGSAAVAMINRVLHGLDRSGAPVLPFYPSLSSHRSLDPTLGSMKLFYCGINWERIDLRKKSRYEDVLKILDGHNILEIYGPKLLFGVEVWEGYESYVDELPFDGTSLLSAANKAGIVLALSSTAHKESGVVSNRLWEGVAAGAYVICDQPDFGRRHFGETLAYVDSDADSATLADEILSHVEWVRKNPDAAMEKCRAAQKLFNEKYALDKTIPGIYSHQSAVVANLNTESGITANVFLPLLHGDDSAVKSCVEALSRQTHQNLHLTIVVDAAISPKIIAVVEGHLKSATYSSCVKMAKFWDGSGNFRGLGPILAPALLERTCDESGVSLIMGPGEILLPNHIASTIATLVKSPDIGVAVSDIVKSWDVDDEQQQAICTNFEEHDPVFGWPLGMSRFIVRNASVKKYLSDVIPYLVGHPFKPALIFDRSKKTGIPSVVKTLDLNRNLPASWFDLLHKDRAIIRELAPSRFTHNPTWEYSDGRRDVLAAFSRCSLSGQSHTTGSKVKLFMGLRKWVKTKPALNKAVHAPRDFLRQIKKKIRKGSTDKHLSARFDK